MGPLTLFGFKSSVATYYSVSFWYVSKSLPRHICIFFKYALIAFIIL